MNIELLIRELRSSRRRDGRCAIFIDFKSAYNTVDRTILYRALLKRGILNASEVQFLRCLHNSLYFSLSSGQRVHLKEGVH